MNKNKTKTPLRLLFLWCVLGLPFILGGCNEVMEYYEFTLQGKISVKGTNPSAGLIRLEVYVAETGEGILKQPLLLFDRFKLTKLGSFSQKVQYPVGMGKGLVVYAWFDANNNGRFCEPNEQNEWSGLVAVSKFPVRVVNVDLVLDKRCAGPELFYP